MNGRDKSARETNEWNLVSLYGVAIAHYWQIVIKWKMAEEEKHPPESRLFRIDDSDCILTNARKTLFSPLFIWFSFNFNDAVDTVTTDGRLSTGRRRRKLFRIDSIERKVIWFDLVSFDSKLILISLQFNRIANEPLAHLL